MLDNNSTPALIVMLTYNDFTVENAEKVFEGAKDSPARYWGMKEKPLSKERMKNLFARMKDCGKTTALEVVGYEEKDALEGAELAAQCGCDILMGTKFSPSVAEFCKTHNMKYFPFIGKLRGRPSVLSGSIEEIVEEARQTVAAGADGIDLLGYRYEGDASALIDAVVKAVDAPVCVAGSIDSFSRLDEIIRYSPQSFTIGSAFFNDKFSGSFSEQIDKVCGYLTENSNVADYIS